MAVSCKGAHWPQEVMLTGGRGDGAYPLSTRHVEALLRERGGHGEPSTLHRGGIKYSPQLEEACPQRQRAVGVSGRLEATSSRGKGQGTSLERAGDQPGQPLDWLLTTHRDEQAAKRGLGKASRRHGVPAQLPIDGSEAQAAALRSDTQEPGTPIVSRPVTSLKNLVEPAPRAVQRVTCPRRGGQSPAAAQGPLGGIELRPRIKKTPMVLEERDEGRSAAEPFSSLAA
jgi:putative transposase